MNNSRKQGRRHRTAAGDDPLPIILRTQPRSRDRAALKKILLSTKLFYPFEIEVALWLLDEALQTGDESGYHFIFADRGKETVGYACYGPITMTENRFDMYWIAVRKDLQGRNIGKLLISETEKGIIGMAGRHVFVETSSREDYGPTRAFYKSCGYIEVARVPDFYKDGDDKIILMKSFP